MVKMTASFSYARQIVSDVSDVMSAPRPRIALNFARMLAEAAAATKRKKHDHKGEPLAEEIFHEFAFLAQIPLVIRLPNAMNRVQLFPGYGIEGSKLIGGD